MNTNETKFESVRLTIGVELRYDPDFGQPDAWAVYWEDGNNLLGHVYPDNDPEEWNWYFIKPDWLDPELRRRYEDAVNDLVKESVVLE